MSPALRLPTDIPLSTDPVVLSEKLNQLDAAVKILEGEKAEGVSRIAALLRHRLEECLTKNLALHTLALSIEGQLFNVQKIGVQVEGA